MKKKIALFANGWSAENLRYYMEALCDEIKEIKADLYVFMGHDTYGMSKSHNDAECCIYELPDMKNFDAAVFFAPGMDFVQMNEEIIRRCNTAGIPVICVGKVINSAISVYTDQYKGMKPLVDHLIEKHHVEKILFIAGPRDHFDSNERLRALTDSCREHGVAFSGSDVFYSNWDVISATRYIRELIDKKKKLPDVIMCANDNTAFYISFVLEDRGIDVPGDILITGFDGTFKAKTFYPSLTSVAQPFAKMGKKTAECLIAVFFGEKVAKKHYIPCEFVIGESCGCDVSAERDVLRRNVCKLICEIFAHSIVFRIGGDEFVAVLWGNDYKNRERLLEGFRQALNDIQGSDSDPHEKISIACGMAVFNSDSKRPVDEALRRADDAMYADKRRIKQEHLAEGKTF